MKITIIGGGNMGGAIAKGLASSGKFPAKDITVVDREQAKIDELKQVGLSGLVDDYSSIASSDIVIFALKPWLVEGFLKSNQSNFNTKQIFISIAAGITLEQLESWSIPQTALYRVMPNTAIAIKQSMTFVASRNASQEQDQLIVDLFANLGKAELIEEKLFSAATALTSCGIAYAFRYIRAAMEGGVEMGFYANQSKASVIQTLRGAIDLLEANDSHPEVEIDKVTTAGGITIQGLNEMEHAGFTSAVIRGLKASNIK